MRRAARSTPAFPVGSLRITVNSSPPIRAAMAPSGIDWISRAATVPSTESPGVVTKRIIHVFEPVEVQKEKRESLLPVLSASSKRGLKFRFDQQAVGQPGKES